MKQRDFKRDWLSRRRRRGTVTFFFDNAVDTWPVGHNSLSMGMKVLSGLEMQGETVYKFRTTFSVTLHLKADGYEKRSGHE